MRSKPPPLPRSHALRRGRHSETGQVYLLTTVTDQRLPVFADFQCARVVVNALRSSDQEGMTETLAWVVMPDHLHWLCALTGVEPLARVMKAVKGRSSRVVNMLESRLKPLPQRKKLWQAGYHDHALRREDDLQSVARYLVANPLRAGLVSRLMDYPHWDAVWV